MVVKFLRLLKNFSILRNSSISKRFECCKMSNPDKNLDKCYEVVSKVVDEVGFIIAEKFKQGKVVDIKSCDIDLVTETDVQVEKHLKENLLKNFPSHKFIGEEEFATGAYEELTNEPTWIIDPIDGTMNFIHGFPQTCTSVALLLDKIVEIGIVFNPILNQKFTARRGQGAFLNGEKIQVSGQDDLSKALVISEFGTSKETEKIEVVHENFRKISALVHGLRASGSAALNMCYVALGGVDANYEMGVHCWDVAAGYLIVTEAGGVVLDTTGDKFDIMSRKVLAASSEKLANSIAKNLTQYQPKPRDDFR